MTMRHGIRNALMLVVVGAVFLQAAQWFRFAGARQIHADYPHFGLGLDHEVTRWRSVGSVYLVDGVVQKKRPLLLWYEYPRSILKRAMGRTDFLSRRSGVLAAHRGETRWDGWVVDAMNAAEVTRREQVYDPRSGRVPPAIVWTIEEGRFACRSRDGGELIGVVGPDGYREAGTPGASFESVIGLFHGASFVDTQARRFYHLSADPRPAAPLSIESLEPARWTVRTHELGGAGPARVVLTEGAIVITVGAEIVVPEADGPGRRIDWDPDREFLHEVSFGKINRYQDGRVLLVSSDRSVVRVRSRLLPFSSTRFAWRMRIAEIGKPTIVRDIVMDPETGAQVAWSRALGAAASARPLVLNLWNCTTRGPASSEEFRTWFWRDPFLSEGQHARWFWASVLIALLCAWRAWSQATMRRPSTRGFWTAAVLLLGPLGLVWMRLCVQKLPVVNGRAVDLESVDWPEPEPRGTTLIVTT